MPGVSDSTPAQPRPQRGRHVHRAVGALVHLEQAGDGAGDRAEGAVERGRRLVLPVRVAVADGQPPGLEGGAVRRAGQLAVGALGGEPRLDVVLARGAGAQVTGGDVDHAVGQLQRLEELLLPLQQPQVLGGSVLGCTEAEHLDLVEPVHADDAAGVLAVGAGLAAEAGRPAGVALRALGQVEHLVGVHAGQRHLGGADEVQVVALDPVHLLVVLAEEAGALHGAGLDQRGGDDRGEAGRDGAADRQLGERELQQGAGPGEEVEARARHLGAALHVDRAEGLADLDVVAHREVVGGHLADGAQGDGVVLTAGRDVAVDDVGDAQVHLAQGGVGLALGLLGLLHLGGQRLGPLQDGGPLLRGRLLDRLGGRLLLPAQVVAAPGRLATGDVGGQERVDQRTRRHPAHAGWHGRGRGSRARVAGRSRARSYGAARACPPEVSAAPPAATRRPPAPAGPRPAAGAAPGPAPGSRPCPPAGAGRARPCRARPSRRCCP